jgi:hypothetical protein
VGATEEREREKNIKDMQPNSDTFSEVYKTF